MENNRVTFIPCAKWVKKGVARHNPEKVQLNKEELVHIINQTRNNLQISENEETGNAPQNENVPMNIEDELNLNNYDNDDEGRGEQLLGINSLVEFDEAAENYFSDSDDSDKDDDLIKSDDNLIVIGRIDGDASILEVYVYNENEESFYVHHDFLLPAYPLCLEWLDHEAGHPPGNYCAVGSMSPIIDIWDLDIINCLEPAFKLGRKPSQKKGITRIGHKDAVLDLAWNKKYDHILASASVDKTILLWDLDQGDVATKINAFDDKVQCIEWNAHESQTLLAGGCDNTVKLFDCRSPQDFKSWQISGEAERIVWDPQSSTSFFVATNSGTLEYFDYRNGRIWGPTQIHEKEVTGLVVSQQCPGLLMTGSPDSLVKIWDYTHDIEPNLVYEKNFDVGSLHCLEFCPDLPFVICVGGDNKKNNFTVFDIQNIEAVKNQFESRSLVTHAESAE